MKEKIYFFIILGMFSLVWTQDQNNAGDAFNNAAQADNQTLNQGQGAIEDIRNNNIQFADEGDPGYVQKLIDFNLLGQGNRFDDPFHIENWIVRLDGAINYSYNKTLTYIKAATDNSGNKSMGIRVNYPRVQINSVATLKPVFAIPFLRAKYKERGFVDNVGVIRSIRMRVRSNIFPYKIVLVLQDKFGNLTKHRFNNRLDYYGWEDLYWRNASYENRYLYNPDERKEPIYPLIVPGVRLHSIEFHRSKGVRLKGGFDPRGTDFVAYIGEVELTYDKAVSDERLFTEEDRNAPDFIDNEEVWQIETDIEKNIIEDQVNKAFDKYKLNLILQRARKRLDTPINDNIKNEAAGAATGAATGAAANEGQAGQGQGGQ